MNCFGVVVELSLKNGYKSLYMICSNLFPTQIREQLILEYINVIIYMLIAYPHNLRTRKTNGNRFFVIFIIFGTIWRHCQCNIPQIIHFQLPAV